VAQCGYTHFPDVSYQLIFDVQASCTWTFPNEKMIAMIARKDAIEKIIKYLDAFVLEVRSYNTIGTYDINIHAENTLIPILNAIFDLELENANHTKRNFPAVDLIDSKNGVAFQLTATTTMDKVSETIRKFIDHGLHKTYSTLFIYILTEKEVKYNDTKLHELTNGIFEFDATVHLIDYTDVLKRINGIVSSEKLQNIARLFEHEFSEIQISSRRKIFRDGFLKNTPENLYLNLALVSFSDRLYIAETSYDENRAKAISNKMNKGKRNKNRVYHPEALFKAIITIKENYTVDWVIREGKLITFRNLQDPQETLTQFIDKGTVEAFNPADFYEDSVDKLNIFKALLKNCLRHLCYTLSMEWVYDRKILRFRNEPLPREKKTKWKGKKESVKTVIFEVMSKKKENEESHIICFRNMAFLPTFHLLDDTWYLSINPTWSFTNPGGFETSRYESVYMSGIKRLENNSSVYYQFRFFAYFLSNIPPLFVEQYSHLKIETIPPVTFSPAIEDAKWIPPKQFAPQNARETELFEDKELNANLF
jgi:hypothetical protein